MKLSYQGIQDKQGYAAAQVALPQYDWAKMAEKTAEKPVWVHFGAGNIFRGFIAGLQQRLLNAGLAESGIVAAETFDYDIIDKIYVPHDSMTLMVSLKADGSTQKEVIASIAKGIKANCADEAQWRQLTADYDAEKPDRLQKEVSEFDQRKSKAEGQCATAQNAIAGREKPNMEQLEAASRAAQSVLKEVSDALEAAKHLHSGNANVLKDLRDGREPLANACKEANTAQHLSDVMAGTESGNRMNLETFVQRSYMEKILCDANRRFRDMSNGQFELKLINVEDAGEGRNKGLDLEVYSIVTGKTRSVNTLSGGESFMAALSLALGMADQIQAATAAIHLDVMFIDEGFGSLSDNARNEAVNILKEMAGKQRQIGIISHVSELKDEIENQLIVKKDDRGSRISWR